MHTAYATAQLHPESPIASTPLVTGIIADAERLFESSHGERWPSRGRLQIGSEAVLRCSNHRAAAPSTGRDILLDVSLDRAETHETAGSHVLFRAWLRSVASAEIVHSSVERVSTLQWMVEEFAGGDWVDVLRRMADERRTLNPGSNHSV